MSLRIYNTLFRDVENFTPLVPGQVRMYVCGMTIYDFCHIGHARMMMAFDIAQRWLKTSGMQVTYVRNITDIDDKIIKRAVERNITIRALTDEMVLAMHEDIGKLGIEPPTLEPRATDYVPQMLGIIAMLSLLPPNDFPEIPLFPGADKLIHSCMYLILCFLACWSMHAEVKRIWYLLIILFSIGWGIMMEVLQLMMNMGRSFEFNDMIGNLIGTLIGSAIYILMAKYNRKNEAVKINNQTI